MDDLDETWTWWLWDLRLAGPGIGKIHNYEHGSTRQSQLCFHCLRMQCGRPLPFRPSDGCDA